MFLLIWSHSSYRFSSLFFLLVSLFSSKELKSGDVFKLTDSFYCLILCSKLYISFFILFTVFFIFRIFLVLFNGLYFLLNFLYSCIISWVHWFVCLCCSESRWASWKLLFGILPQIICRFYPCISHWVFFISVHLRAQPSLSVFLHWLQWGKTFTGRWL